MVQQRTQLAMARLTTQARIHSIIGWGLKHTSNTTSMAAIIRNAASKLGDSHCNSQHNSSSRQHSQTTLEQCQATDELPFIHLCSTMAPATLIARNYTICDDTAAALDTSSSCPAVARRHFAAATHLCECPEAHPTPGLLTKQPAHQ